MPHFWIGLALGVLLTIPLIVLFSRRTARRVLYLEQRARAADRLTEQAMLTGGLAHEIKNPLSSINLNVQLLQEDLTDLRKDAARHAQQATGVNPGDDRIGRVQRRFESLARETRRLKTILEDFLRFAGRMKLEKSPTDVNALASDLVDFFQPQAQSMGVTVRPQLSSGPLIASVDESLLKQAMLNLMINACQAMAGVRTGEAAHGGAVELMIRTSRARDESGEHLALHITDTGPGISAEDQTKIFQPYYSTKKGGTGLGLPTTRRIIEEHGGTITVHSEPGKGSDFVIRLPVGELT